MSHHDFTCDHLGQILGWTNQKGEPVLYPARQHTRPSVYGGIKLIVPCRANHGLLQNLRPSYQDVELLTWSLQRHMVHSAHRIQLLPTPNFPWQHAVLIESVRSSISGQLTLTITVERSFSCGNPNPMPLEVALQCYLASAGKKIVLRCGEETMCGTELPHHTVRHLPNHFLSQQLVAEVTHGRMIIAPVVGFDGVRVFGDCYDEFLCVVFTASAGRPTPLKPGQCRRFICQFTFVDTQ